MKKNIGFMSVMLFIFMMLISSGSLYAQLDFPCVPASSPCDSTPWSYRSFTAYVDSNCYVEVFYKVRDCATQPCEFAFEKIVVQKDSGSGGVSATNCVGISTITIDEILQDVEMTLMAKVTWIFPCNQNNDTLTTARVYKPACWKKDWVWCEGETQYQIFPCDDSPCCIKTYQIDRRRTPVIITEVDVDIIPNEPFECDEEQGCYNTCD